MDWNRIIPFYICDYKLERQEKETKFVHELSLRLVCHVHDKNINDYILDTTHLIFFLM